MKVASKPSGMGLGDEGKEYSNGIESVHMSKNASKGRLDKNDLELTSNQVRVISHNKEYVVYGR